MRITGRRPISRRRCYWTATVWLLLTAIWAVQLALAEDSVSRWLFGVACCLALVVAVGHLGAVVGKDRYEGRR